MSDPNRQLRDVFQAHESSAPDAATVMQNVDGRIRGARRRRLVVRAAGVSVLGAGIVVTGLNIPAWTSHSTIRTIKTADGGSSSTPSPSPSPTDTTTPPPTTTVGQWTQSEEFAAYFANGYDYANAQALAQMWGMSTSSSIGAVKAKAGLKILNGQSLGVTPSNTPESTSDWDQDEFFAAGYDSTDAETLAQQWNVGEQQAKTKAGAKLLAKEALPIQPSGSTDGVTLTTRTGSPGGTATADTMSPALQEFFDAGYDYNDAVALAQAWGESSGDSNIDSVKAQAGQKLLNGQSLPVQPSGTPAPQTEQDVAAFFNAGYDYNDAVTLAQKWGESNVYNVKIEAGQKLLNGQTLPVQPSS